MVSLPDHALERIGFRPFARADLPMAAEWLRTPEVRAWWVNPDEQLAGLAEDLDDPDMAQEIVTLDGDPFAFVQHYACAIAPECAHMPAAARGIDTFIGRPDLIGRGLGPVYLRALSDRLLAQGAPALVADPDSSNERAVRAWRRAGFAGSRIAPGHDGNPVLFLERWPAERAKEPIR